MRSPQLHTHSMAGHCFSNSSSDPALWCPLPVNPTLRNPGVHPRSQWRAFPMMGGGGGLLLPTKAPLLRTALRLRIPRVSLPVISNKGGGAGWARQEKKFLSSGSQGSPPTRRVLKVSNLRSRANHHASPFPVSAPPGQVRSAAPHPPPVVPSRRPTAPGTPLLTWAICAEKEPQEDRSGRAGARRPSTRAGRRRHRRRLAATVPRVPSQVSRE